MKILMIHEVKPWMLDVDLSEFDEITFDDGLLSQYLNFNHFLKFKKPLSFFISTNIVAGNIQNTEIISCSEAHKLFFENNDKSYYMNWEQIIDIYNTESCYIGGHSHQHNIPPNLGIKSLYNILKTDTMQMLNEFSKKNIKIDKFCFPYNKEHPLYRTILSGFGIKRFYGAERIAIERLYR